MAAPTDIDARAVALVGSELRQRSAYHRDVARTLLPTTQAADIAVHDLAARIYDGLSSAYTAEHPTTEEA